MVRTVGAKNADHEQRRRAMLDKIARRLGQRGATRASWRELAAAAGVSLATLTHYFGKRDDVVRAVLLHNLTKGEKEIAKLATPEGDVARSIRSALDHVAAGLRYGVGEMLAVGLIEGLRHPGLGPTVVDASLEPMIQALANRLRSHQQLGEMRRDVDPRLAALQLLSPLLLAHLHQSQLGGEREYPLEMEALVGHIAEIGVMWTASGSADA